MKIAVSSTGENLDSAVDQRFGRCQYFIVYDVEKEDFQCLENGAKLASGGAGIQSAQTVAESGASVVLTGNVGPNAYQGLQAADVTIITGVQGTVGEVVRAYLKGDFEPTVNPTVGSHHGMG